MPSRTATESHYTIKCHAKSMMSNEANERLIRDTQHVPLRQNAEHIDEFLFSGNVVFFSSLTFSKGVA